MKIFHGPKLSVCRVRFRSEQIPGRILVQTFRQTFNLKLGQLGAVTTSTLVNQSVQRVLSVRAAPAHKTAATATGDPLNIYFVKTFAV